jgi:hypothetical protein
LVKSNRLKKWFMLQVWRLQQVAQIITLLLLAMNLSLQLFDLVKWRGEVLKNPYFTVPLIFLIMFAIIWVSAIFWDLRLKMWRDQATVLVERNPYTKERLNAKEMAQYGLIWIPILERLGKEDKKLAETAEVLKQWVKKEWEEDPVLVKDVNELFGHIGSDRIDLTGLKQKKP